LGVRVSVPGGSGLLIEPPACRLEHARGSVPLPNGAVAVSWRRTSAGMQLECTVPAGVTATVRLPAGAYGIQGPTAGPAVVRSGPGGAAGGGQSGTGRMPDGNGTRDFRIHTGTWAFTPSNES
jgi:alpha-L-rhamnosidase